MKTKMQYALLIFFMAMLGLTNSWAIISPKTIVVRLSSRPETLDWNRATSGSEGAVIQNMMEGLFQYNTNSNPVPALAERFNWSKDGRTLNLIIKKGVFWSDGKPLLAQHFADSFQRLLDPTLNSPNASILFAIKNAKDYFYGKVKTFKEVGVQVKGQHKLSIELDEPRANFLHTLTYWATFPYKSGATLGTYQLISQSPTEIKLKSKNAAIKDLVFKVIPNGKDALKAYENKEVDYLLQVEDDLATDSKKFDFIDSLRVVVLLHFNPERIHTNTPEKRRAIMNMIMKLNLVGSSATNRVKPRGLIPPGIIGAQDSQPPQNLKAGALPDVPLVLGFPQNQLSQTIAEELRTLSQEIKIRTEVFTPQQNPKHFDLILTIFGLDFMDPDQLLSTFLSQGTHDLFNFNSPELPGLITQARKDQNTAERGRLYAKAADYLQYQAAIVAPLFYRRRAFLLRPIFKRSPNSVKGSPIIQGLY